MSSAVVGYVRVSSADQNPDRQIAQLKEAGVTKLFVDKISGVAKHRPALAELCEYVREGDEVVVTSIDRLVRSVEQLHYQLREWREKGVAVRFLKEGLQVTVNQSPLDTLFLSVIGSISEFEREIIRERQREGIALAKARGVYKGRKRSLSADEIEQLQQDAKVESNKSALAKKYGIGRTTLYRYLAETEEKGS